MPEPYPCQPFKSAGEHIDAIRKRRAEVVAEYGEEVDRAAHRAWMFWRLKSLIVNIQIKGRKRETFLPIGLEVSSNV